MKAILHGAAIGALFLLGGSLCSCGAAKELLLEPAPDDPLDGYEGSLAEAGVSTEVDWGPQQELLLGQFTTVKEEHRSLQNLVAELQSENQNLAASLSSEQDSLDTERRQRVQSDAEIEHLRRIRHDLEAKVLTLNIEKAKLEQEALLGKIANMERSLAELEPKTPAAAAAPPGGKR